jgi:hypothetical protein
MRGNWGKSPGTQVQQFPFSVMAAPGPRVEEPGGFDPGVVPAIHAERHRKRFLEEMARYINDFSISREPAERLGVDTRDKPAHDESHHMPHLRARGFAPLA